MMNQACSLHCVLANKNLFLNISSMVSIIRSFTTSIQLKVLKLQMCAKILAHFCKTQLLALLMKNQSDSKDRKLDRGQMQQKRMRNQKLTCQQVNFVCKVIMNMFLKKTFTIRGICKFQVRFLQISTIHKMEMAIMQTLISSFKSRIRW